MVVMYRKREHVPVYNKFRYAYYYKFIKIMVNIKKYGYNQVNPVVPRNSLQLRFNVMEKYVTILV